jgi:hypothetical protein
MTDNETASLKEMFDHLNGRIDDCEAKLNTMKGNGSGEPKPSYEGRPQGMKFDDVGIEDTKIKADDKSTEISSWWNKKLT